MATRRRNPDPPRDPSDVTLVAPRGSIVVVIRTPIDMKRLTRIMSAIGTSFPKAQVQTAPKYHSVQIDAWLLEIGGEGE